MSGRIALPRMVSLFLLAPILQVTFVVFIFGDVVVVIFVIVIFVVVVCVVIGGGDVVCISIVTGPRLSNMKRTRERKKIEIKMNINRNYDFKRWIA